MIDLHVHSNASDGTMTPTELVTYAKNKGIKAIALTDHDTINGVREAKAVGAALGVEVISGIELSTSYNNKDVHILGLFIDENNKGFIDELDAFKESRSDRNEMMIERLNELGIDISNEDLSNESCDGVITRAHFAKVLLKKGYIKKIDEAFKKYIGDNCPAFIPRSKVTPESAINLIKKYNGISILAHPFLYDLSTKGLIGLIEHLKEEGLDGIEAIYSLHSGSEQSYIKQLAKKYDLLISGGSDFHGSNKPFIDLGVGKGKLLVPDAVLEKLKLSLI
ncbi:hypothetical protein EDC18_10170 [Natranaerovirga pectinivora]|uniref:Polymerase/histidinol phosphatase N-terminal domain-containing protein n=1 Tax=Natranaerovirga pectinivora TaxID=682400 RepID=A0A4R3MNE3_9FIRM|nr:PHP domain-containing protein [Natranaerovirga pectinivora]TCT16775.1 hypothetical protein EDC18_10170 [Natranaerovirga pectinivora]